MKKFYILFGIISLLSVSVFSQSIRKNYLEMTDDEKLDLVNAFYQLRTGPDLINNIATFHADHFNFTNTIDPSNLSVHNNLPDRPEMDIFLAWHRRQVFEVEQAMQDLNPNVSIPYWNTVTDQSITSPLWDQNFLGQFDADWSLGRDLAAAGALPQAADLVSLLNRTDYLSYSNAFERGGAHTGPHVWTGGAMRTGVSPRDPVFYLHHSNVDRLWAEWQEVHQASVFQITSMIRYDGTFVFNGQTLPLVNPNDIVDPRFYGVFYAENQLAILDNYTVSNTYNAQENFYYQFTIETGTNFIIPSGNDCKFESVNEIILKPGFEAASGSSFIAKIDNQAATKLLQNRGNEIVRNQIPFDDIELNYNAYSNLESTDDVIFESNVYPNPFSSSINIQIAGEHGEVEVIIYNFLGQQVYKELHDNGANIELNELNSLVGGIYILKVVDKNNLNIITKKLVKRK